MRNSLYLLNLQHKVTGKEPYCKCQLILAVFAITLFYCTYQNHYLKVESHQIWSLRFSDKINYCIALRLVIMIHIFYTYTIIFLILRGRYNTSLELLGQAPFMTIIKRQNLAEV